METLTLARFVCEMTLQEYDYARERPSKLAASSLLLALTMKNLGGWVSMGTRGGMEGRCDVAGMAVAHTWVLCRPPRWSITAGTVLRTCTPW